MHIITAFTFTLQTLVKRLVVCKRLDVNKEN